MTVRFLSRAVLTVFLVLGLAVTALAAAKDDYARGVSAFNSLQANEKRAGLRSEWVAVMKPFERALAAEPKGEYAPKCMFFLGRSYEELGRRSITKADRMAALDAYDRLLRAYPRHRWADDAMFRKGLIWQEQFGNKAQAEAVFKALVATYPKGDMVPEVRKRLGLDDQASKPQPSGPAVKETAQPQTGSGAPSASPAKKVAARVKAESALLGIRHWSSHDYTRVVMDMKADVKYERTLVERADSGGKQLQLTLQRTDIAPDVTPARSIQDGILSQIRVGADADGGALVTFDLMQMDHYRVFTLPDPYRVVLDIYGSDGGKTTAAPAAQPAAGTEADKGAPLDHVQAALADLQAKQSDRKADRQPETPAGKQPAAQQPAPASVAPQKAGVKSEGKGKAQAKAERQQPEITVSAKQKKYSGSLIEQLGLKVRTIMIDAGHGGKDPGALANGVKEKDVNLRMAKLLGRMLQEQGFEIHYTRSGDKFIPLEERTAMANARDADLFISLHCNAHKDADVHGLEVYYLNLATDAQAVRVAARENGVSAKKISDMQFILSDLMLNSKINESRQMAALVEQEALRAMRPRYSLASHGSKGAFFYVLTGARMPAVLVEIGYLTNGTEAQRLNSDAYLSTMAQGLAGGVVAYKKKLERFALGSSGKS